MLIRLLGLWVAETGGAGVKWGVGEAFWVKTGSRQRVKVGDGESHRV